MWWWCKVHSFWTWTAQICNEGTCLLVMLLPSSCLFCSPEDVLILLAFLTVTIIHRDQGNHAIPFIP